MGNHNIAVIENQEELKSEIQRTAATQIQVVDQVSFGQANQFIGKLQSVKKEVEARFSEPKKKAKAAHSAICELEKEFLSPVLAAIDGLKRKTTAWYTAEQVRIAAEQERRRIEAESLAAAAAEAEEQGEADFAAEAVALAAVEAANVSYTPKTKGTAMRESWSAVVIDPDKIPREYLVVNQTALDAVARATKGTINIPGVEFRKDFINSTRAQ